MSVKGVMDKHGKIYNSVPMLAQTVGEYYVLLEEIKEVGAWTEMDTTGETSAKIVAKAKLASLASRLAASGMVYAFDREDTELEAALDYAYYKIRYARDSETLQIAGAISTELLNHRANLAGYMVTEEHLADLQEHIQKFKEAMEIKGGAKSRRVADTKRLVRLFKSTDDILYRKMDKLMIRLKTDYPDFFIAYRSARKIVDL